MTWTNAEASGTASCRPPWSPEVCPPFHGDPMYMRIDPKDGISGQSVSINERAFRLATRCKETWREHWTLSASEGSCGLILPD